MRLSYDILMADAGSTGFRPEILEKSELLLGLLQNLADDPFLGSRLVLKGGTALNLFLFDVPRLSLDADLNYIGSADVATLCMGEQIERIGAGWGSTMLRLTAMNCAISSSLSSADLAKQSVSMMHSPSAWWTRRRRC